MSQPTQPASSPRISLAMIVRDADSLLASTLSSVGQHVDEMIVVDTGSHDNSVAVAREAGAKVFHHPWQDDFSAARNACLAHAGGDWILWLDAGETMSARALEDLRRFAAAEARPDQAYALFVVVPPESDHVSSEQIARVRFVPRRAELKFAGRIRETLAASLEAAQMTVQPLDISIRRPASDRGRETKHRKATRDLGIAQAALAAEGPAAALHLTVADAQAALGETDKALETYRKAIAAAERGSTTQLEAYYGLLALYDADPEQRETQLATSLEALDAFPLDAQLLSAMGGYMLAQNRPDLAVRSYTIAVEHGQVEPFCWHLSELGEVCAACLSLTQQLLQQDDQALETLDAALEIYPESERLRRQLLNLHIKHGRNDKALEEFELLPSDVPQREALRSAVRGGLLAAKQNWPAALPYLEAAYRAECRDPICLRWLIVTYFATGAVDLAEPVIHDWAAVEPNNAEVHTYLSSLAAHRAAQAKSASDEPNPTAGGTPPARTIRVDSPKPAAAGTGRRDRAVPGLPPLPSTPSSDSPHSV